MTTLPVPTIVDVPPPEADAGFGALSTPKGNLPLKALDVRARIDGLLARTVVRQRFTNPHAEALEATYIFPLPPRAAVNRFVMRVGPRTIEGELQERAKAREAYEQALKAGHRAAIAEEERPDVFTMRVGNLPPNESIDVELTLTGPLPVDHGEATFRFPLVVAPRYIPGKPLDGASVGDGTHTDTDQVPNASRITPPVLLPGQPNPVCLSLSVEVHPGALHVSDFRSSVHAVTDGEANDVLHFALRPDERLDRDFILRWRIDDSQLTTSLQFHADAGDSSTGTFALTLIPPRDAGHDHKPRDVVFVLDRSGSMDGWKMIAARRALGRMIDSLTDRDRFAVLAFDDTVERYAQADALESASDRQRFRAVEWLARIASRGGTEMAAPLKAALQLLHPSPLVGEGKGVRDKDSMSLNPSPQPSPTRGEGARDRILVLVTDGQVGNEDHLLRTVSGALEGVRVFALGIDQAVNEGFLKRLAGLGGGYCELVESEDRLDAVMDKVHRRIRSPLLTSVKLEPAGLQFEPGTLIPARLPDLFPGTPLTILGRYRRPEQSPALCIQATDDAGRPWSQTVRGERGEVLAPVWARGHLRDLEDRYATTTGDRPALEQQMVATSLKFNVLCRFTAFVAVDVTEIVNPGGEVRRITQPVDAPAGWDTLKRDPAIHIGYAALGALPAFAAGRLESVDSCLAEFNVEDFEIATRAASVAPKRGGPNAGLQPLTRSLPPTADLIAYRKRADELRRRLESAADPLRELGVLRVKLEELLDDLRSIGAPVAQFRPLVDLVTELQAFLAAPADVGAMVKCCAEVLSAFAGGAAPKRHSWWK